MINTETFFVSTRALFVQHYPHVACSQMAIDGDSVVLYIKKSHNPHILLDLWQIVSPLHKNLIIIIENGAHAVIHDIRSQEYKAGRLPHVPLESVIQLDLQTGARLTYFFNEDLSGNCVHTTTFNMLLARDAHLSWYGMCGGAHKQTVTFNLLPQGMNAHAQVQCMYLQKATQTLSIAVQQRHITPGASTDVQCKGIVAQQAQVTYEGLIHIGLQGSGSTARQTTKNIVLGASATVSAKPQLEVLNNAVVCSHGAAVGQCDLDALAYMQTRGLCLKEAQKLLLYAFLHMGDDARIAHLAQLMHARLDSFLNDI